MMKTIDRRHAVPFALVTSMFLLWGLANNMTDTLLAAFKRIMSMSDTQTSLIQFAFYGSYFCFALPAALFIRRRSFKSGIILGLLLYAAGAMLFLPAARVASYGFYLVAIYVMAGGCSVLETTANPYVMSMGDPRTRIPSVCASIETGMAMVSAASGPRPDMIENAVANTEPVTISGGCAAPMATLPRKISSSVAPIRIPSCKLPQTRPVRAHITSGRSIIDTPSRRPSSIPRAAISPSNVAVSNIVTSEVKVGR